MPNGSIYVPKDEKFTGASPQNLYVTFWFAGRKNRLRIRAAIAVAGFVAGNMLGSRLGLNAFVAGVVLGALAGGVDWFVAWRLYERTAVWRGKRRGEVRTGRLLRLMLRRHGYRVMDGRAVPGEASIDHLVIGPGGVWIVDNEAWSPDTLIARYGERLFFDEKFGTSVAKGLISAAESMAVLLTKETGIAVTIVPVLAIHGGKIKSWGGVLTGEGLTVAYPRRVAGWIRANGTTAYTEEQIDLLARTAARILRRMS
ncbi:nuclease-related domain-containing protein [Microbispora amethystogenes]|uniref:nuclease-related domain-containing protein n=1 Tax=Microbispora amethystogenes TaxID=1427754 RepID=UPI0033CA68A2